MTPKLEHSAESAIQDNEIKDIPRIQAEIIAHPSLPRGTTMSNLLSDFRPVNAMEIP
jgi:hypothetical protein